MRSTFGWSLPPGVTPRMIEEQAGGDAACEVCGKTDGDCICPECPYCKVVGDVACYRDTSIRENGHPKLALNKDQLFARSRIKVAQLNERIQDEERYRAWLADQPSDYKEELHE